MTAVPVLERGVKYLRRNLRRASRRPAAGAHSEPELIRLEAEGMPGDGKPPVRIFLGTEPAQHRAERVFLWSIEAVRDRTRLYEIHLMKELAGFDRRWWTTGFSNYRLAIPCFAGGNGRAIYNDVDQIYLSDPAALFDADMNGHGFLALASSRSDGVPFDSSVMLIDCARMAALWTLEAAQRERRSNLLGQAAAVPGLWGKLQPEWNARDEEYVAGRSHLLHYTRLRTQPWHPFPDLYAYRRTAIGDVWLALERAADEAGFYGLPRGSSPAPPSPAAPGRPAQLLR